LAKAARQLMGIRAHALAGMGYPDAAKKLGRSLKALAR
jgi:hypothetical protein